MDASQTALFGRFPRRVGTPNQHWVFSEAQFDLFLDTIEGVRNAYTTVNQMPIDPSARGLFRLNANSVFYDFDGNKDALPRGEDTPADEAVALMRGSSSLAKEVIGDAVADARELAQRSAHDGVPVLGVFSGFGVHVHQLYQPTAEGVQTKQASTARRYIDLLDLQTADTTVIDNGQRICRVPNVERTTTPGPRGEVRDGRGTGLWTVPLDGADLRTLKVRDLLDLSTARRPVEHLNLQPEDRPEMGVFTDYVDDLTAGSDGYGTPRPVEERETTDEQQDDARALLEELVRMPCMVERLDQPNPCHTVRVNGAVMLFNAGLTVSEVMGVFRSLNWTDWDHQTTKKHLTHIHRSGYSDQNCSTLREKGLCVKDHPVDCRTYGWGGGRAEWLA